VATRARRIILCLIAPCCKRSLYHHISQLLMSWRAGKLCSRAGEVSLGKEQGRRSASICPLSPLPGHRGGMGLEQTKRAAGPGGK